MSGIAGAQKTHVVSLAKTTLAEGARTGLPWWGFAAAAIVADFATKELVRSRMVEGESLHLAPFFNLVSAAREPRSASSRTRAVGSDGSL
jgi:hypothetical protein